MRPKPKSECWFCWREHKSDGETMRLLVPWSDPSGSRAQPGGLFATTDEALAAKREVAPREKWVLCVLTLSPIKVNTARRRRPCAPQQRQRSRSGSSRSR